MMENARLLSDLVTLHAARTPERTAYTWLSDAGCTHLSFGELHQRAQALAAHLQALGLEGKPALLLYEPGLEFVIAFFACQLGGIIAVPAYPPEPARLARTLPRLAAVARDARTRFVLTTARIKASAGMLCALEASLADLTFVASDEPLPAASLSIPERGPDSIAFLQYTSGSTGTPKGVIITHAQVMANLAQLAAVTRGQQDDVFCSWVPFYHDMGLVGGVLLAPYLGGSSVLLSPLDFLKQPSRWLRACAEHGATITSAPNFAYELCLRKVRDEELTGVDLSRLRVAGNGAEPVRADTLRRFAQRFAGWGLRAEALQPAYGLAEAVVLVSGARGPQGVRTLELGRQALAGHRVARAENPQDVVVLTSSGLPAPGIELTIVHPERCTPAAPGVMGLLSPISAEK